jgi:UDP-N-acetylglucosamine--N-acetylmuramyl-(pentapeptide) pyrophosphoryl-undecaprenol N-acetylglucosamine transferase
VYPALVVARALAADRESEGQTVNTLYVGSQGGVEEALVAQAGLPLETIPAGGVRGLTPWRIAINTFKLARGFRTARRILRRFAPDVVFVTGGYVCMPVAMAASLQSVPILIYLPDLEPGLAIRSLARVATRVAVSFPEAERHFSKHKSFVSGYPVREALLKAEKAAAREFFQLEKQTPTLTVFGGSRGARSINRAVSAVLETLLDTCQVIHVSGRLDAAEMSARQEGLSPTQKARYRLYDYLDEMPLALAAADLAVARAGAATLGEFPALGLPAVLVPYPYAGAHQRVNADFLTGHGAAVKVANADLPDKLLPTVRSLLGDRERLAQMARSAKTLARPDAADRIAREIVRLAEIGTTEG